MKGREVERFVGIPYDAGTFDCVDLVALVQRELFGRTISMPRTRPRGIAGSVALSGLSKAYAVPREGGWEDGDLVLMFDPGQSSPGHAGIFLHLGHEDWILHANERNGCSVLHRMRELAQWGLRIEGVYQWLN